MIYNETLDEIPLNDCKNVCGSCTLSKVLFVIFIVISTFISVLFLFLLACKKKDNVRVKFNPSTQTTIY